MSLEDDIEALSTKGSVVERALDELSLEERSIWLGALDSGDFKHVDLAAILSRHSKKPVNGRSVGHHAEKRRREGYV